MAASDGRHSEVETYVSAVTSRTAQLWRQVDPNDIKNSWLQLSTEAYAYVSIGQMAAAAGADPYISAVSSAVPLGAVQPRAFAGVASDGRNLLSLLQQPAIKALVGIAGGYPPERALQIGGNSLMSIAGTMVMDAARASEHTAIAARPAITGYVRVLNPPSCARCAILAGKWYRWNQGFQRHPRCDCVHEPSQRNDARPTQPKEYFDSLPRKLQERYFGKADSALIRSGEVDLITQMSRKTNLYRKSGVSKATATSPIPKNRVLTILDHDAHDQMMDAYRRAASAAMSGDTATAAVLRNEARGFAARAYAERGVGAVRVMPEQLTDGASRAQAIAGLTHYGYLN